MIIKVKETDLASMSQNGLFPVTIWNVSDGSNHTAGGLCWVLAGSPAKDTGQGSKILPDVGLSTRLLELP